MTSTYIDPIAYLKQPTGLRMDTYTGNLGRITASLVAATSLTVTSALIVALNQYDPLYIFDGPNSEVLQVGSAGAAVGATVIPLQAATAFAHAGGTVYCTDGSAVSLGEQIFIVSRWIEDDICHQQLWQTAYVGEILTMPTMRAAIDNQNNLHFRPRHFPVTALTSVTILTNITDPIGFDPTAAIIDSDQQTVDIPLLTALPSSNQGRQSSPWLWQTLNRNSNAWITLSYTAGFPPGALPAPITRACSLLTSDMFSQIVNPVGADNIHQGKRAVTFVIRGETSGESLLVKQARNMLSPYVTQSF